MIIKELQLVNYRQHQRLSKKFEGNLIGVLGPNGSGKSHFMHAMEFAFAGRVPGQNKSDMLRWGADEGHVRVIFEHDGVQGEIYRALHSTTAKFKYGDNDEVTGISKVNEAIAETTQLNADICKQAVFVHQKEVDAVLFTEPSVRQQAWQRLCGLGDAAYTHEKLGKFLTSLPEVQDYTERLEEAQTRIAELEQNLKSLREDLEITQEGLQDLQSFDAILETLRQFRETVQRGQQESETLNTEQATVHRLEQDLQKVSAQIEELTASDPVKSLEALQEKHRECTRSFNAANQANKYRVEITEVKKQLEELSCDYTREQVEQLEADVQQCSVNLASAKSHYEMSAKLDDAVSGTGEASTCPLCLQPVNGDLKSLARELKDKAKIVVDELTQGLQEASGKLQKAKQSLQQYEQQQVALNQKLSSVDAQLSEVSKSITVDVQIDDVKHLQGEIEEAQSAVDALSNARMQKSSIEGSLNTYRQAVKQRSESVEQLIKQASDLMASLGVSNYSEADAKHEEVSTERARCQEAHQEKARVTGKISEVESHLANLKSTLETLRERERQQATLKSAIDTLTGVRQWFHYQNGPQAVINSLLEQIAAGVNDFLDRFGANFYAIPDYGTTSFRYWYNDGRTPPEEDYPSVDEMSGGEAVVLAVSFRFATYCLFASRIGLLTLDEPTVYLDDGNIGRFCNLLQRVKELASNMNLQIFISTHEKAVIPFTDTTIAFGTYNSEDHEHEQHDPTE